VRGALVVLALSSVAAAAPPPEAVPSRYAITLAPDLAHRTFSGRESIDVTLAAPTRTIALDAVGLAVIDARVEAGGETLAASVRYDEPAEKLVLGLPRAVAAGPARIVLAWKAPLSRDLDGFYTIDARGRRWAFTHFEPTSARRAFPSFDAPRYKARFILTVVTDAGDEAVSNTPVDERAPLDATHVMTRFAETEPLPTYLVAVAVGRFARLHATVGRTSVAVVAPAADLPLGRFALDTVAALLPRMEAYFARPYPFAKLDLVAVPAFAPGGMENAATIFLRDDRILVDPAVASPAATHAVARLVAHELAHQWLGDLVTPRGWNDLWLNEATATYVAHELVAAWRPAWRPWDELQSALGGALSDDELPTTHAVRPAAVGDRAARVAFDSMVYDKGAAVLRLGAAWLGGGVMREALRRYVDAGAFAGADAADFWRALDDAAGRQVSPVLRPWIETAGHPLVSVDGACEGGVLALHVHETPARWPLLLSLRTPAGGRVALVADGATLRIDDADGDAGGGGARGHGAGGCPAWVDANGGRLGFYRVAYAAPLAHALTAAAPTLEPAERVGLLSDAWFDVQRGAAPITDYLALVARLRGERAPAVLAELGARLEFLGSELVPAAQRPAFARFVEELLVPAYTALGFNAHDGDDDGVRLARAAVIDLLGRVARSPEILAAAGRALRPYLGAAGGVRGSGLNGSGLNGSGLNGSGLNGGGLNGSGLNGSGLSDGAIADVVVGLAAEHGDERLFDTYVGRVRGARSPAERARFLDALPQFPAARLMHKALSLALTDAVPVGELPRLAVEIAASGERRRAVEWSFLKSHFDTLDARVPRIGWLVGAAQQFCDDAAARDVARFLEPRSRPETVRATVDRIVSCASVRRHATEALADWLRVRYAVGFPGLLHQRRKKPHREIREIRENRILTGDPKA